MRNVKNWWTMVAVLVASITLLVLGRWDRAVQSRQEQWADQVKVLLKQHQAFVQAQQRLQRASAQNASRARHMEAAVAATDSALNTANLQLADAQNTVDSNVALVKANAVLIVRADSAMGAARFWRAARTADSIRADNAEARLAAFQANAREGLKIVECRMLGVGFLPRCPSRTTSYLLGIGTVVVVKVVHDAVNE